MKITILFIFAIIFTLTLEIAYSESENPPNISQIENNVFSEDVISGIYPITTKHVQYNIPYSITNGTVWSMTPKCNEDSLTIKIIPDGNGELLISVPKNLINIDYDGSDDKFVVFLNGGKIPFEQITNEHSKDFKIQFPSYVEEIKIKGYVDELVFRLDTACVIEHNPPYSKILPPLKQIKNGVFSEDVICRDGLKMIVNPLNEKVACVSEMTAKKILERNWASLIVDVSYDDVSSDDFLKTITNTNTSDNFITEISTERYFFNSEELKIAYSGLPQPYVTIDMPKEIRIGTPFDINYTWSWVLFNEETGEIETSLIFVEKVF